MFILTGAWDAVVENNQAGLIDVAQMRHNPALAAAPLTESEAWHHFQAGRNGVIDSARFLVTFGMVPSVQTGGSALHLAAAQGLVDRCKQLLASPELNIDVDIEKADGVTPLLVAATMGHADVAQVLLEVGAGFNQPYKPRSNILLRTFFYYFSQCLFHPNLCGVGVNCVVDTGRCKYRACRVSRGNCFDDCCLIRTHLCSARTS